MIFSKISYNETAYYSLHAEQCLNNLRMESGLFVPIVYRKTLDNICEDIRNDQKNNVFVLDCKGVENIQINAVEKQLADLVNNRNKTVIFENAKESLLEQLAIYSFFKESNEDYLVAEEKTFSFFSLNSKYDCSRLVCTDQAFESTFLEKITIYNTPPTNGKIEHTSSSVLLTSYIDIKRFLIEERLFMLYSIYLLAMKIKKHWLDVCATGKRKPILVCQSLNGSYIASVLSSLLNLDLYMLDQVGPINKLYRAVGAKIKADAEYIVVSDMVCLGTEVKIVKNIIEYLGGNYIGNVTIVRTASVRKFNNVEEVFVIDRENCNQLNYKIITAIE